MRFPADNLDIWGRFAPRAFSQVFRQKTWVWRSATHQIGCCAIGALLVAGIFEVGPAAGQQIDSSQRPAAQLLPITGLGPTVPNSVRRVPAQTVRFQQESLPPSLQTRQQDSESRASEEEGDSGIVTLLKPLSVQPRRREVLTQRYPDGKIQIERQVVQDQFGNYPNDGKWKMYHTDGQLMGLGNYDKGQKVGLWKRVHFERDSEWFQTRDFQGFQFPLVSSAEFKDGQLDGLWVIKDIQDRKIFELRYRDGQRDGTGSWWYPNGQQRRQLECRQDLLHGQWSEWDEQGKLVRENWFREGRRIVRNVSYFQERQPEIEQSYLEPKLELVTQDDWWNARLGTYEPVGEMVQEGPIRAWYDNGQKHMVGYFREGMKEGPFAWWHPNGNRKLLGSYEQGERSGRWIWWHENGIKAAEVTFENDQPVSDFLTWDENGVQTSPDEFMDSIEDRTQSVAKPPLTGTPPKGELEELPGPKQAEELEDTSTNPIGNPDDLPVDQLDLTQPGGADPEAESAAGDPREAATVPSDPPPKPQQ